MRELYLFAFVNLAICMAVVFISICRLNAMGPHVLMRVRAEYAGYIVGALVAGLQPWWGEWPRWGSIGIAAALLGGLLWSARAWRNDTPPTVATDMAPLGER